MLSLWNWLLSITTINTIIIIITTTTTTTTAMMTLMTTMSEHSEWRLDAVATQLASQRDKIIMKVLGRKPSCA